MNDHNETFNNLFNNLKCFSPEIDESDLYAPPSHATTSHSSNSPISNFNIRFLSQNVNKSNAITHSLLNSCGHNTDVFLYKNHGLTELELISRQVLTKLECQTTPNSIISYRISHQNTNQTSQHIFPNITLAGPSNPDQTSFPTHLLYYCKSRSNLIRYTRLTYTTQATPAL